MSKSDYVRRLRSRIGNDLLHIPGAAVVLFDDQHRLLMALRPDTKQWMIIGGGIDPGELPSDTALREVYEETGLITELTGLRGVFGGPDFRDTLPNGDQVQSLVILFDARVTGGTLKAEQEEVATLRYVTEDEAASLPMSPGYRVLVDAAFGRSANYQAASWQP